MRKRVIYLLLFVVGKIICNNRGAKKLGMVKRGLGLFYSVLIKIEYILLGEGGKIEV